MATIQTAADWQKQWFEIADATYLNTAAHAAMPRVALHGVQTSIEVNKSPHHMDDVVFFRSSKPNSGIPLENDSVGKDCARREWDK
jgi:hypothetical protein